MRRRIRMGLIVLSQWVPGHSVLWVPYGLVRSTRKSLFTWVPLGQRRILSQLLYSTHSRCQEAIHIQSQTKVGVGGQFADSSRCKWTRSSMQVCGGNCIQNIQGRCAMKDLFAWISIIYGLCKEQIARSNMLNGKSMNTAEKSGAQCWMNPYGDLHLQVF